MTTYTVHGVGFCVTTEGFGNHDDAREIAQAYMETWLRGLSVNVAERVAERCRARGGISGEGDSAVDAACRVAVKRATRGWQRRPDDLGVTLTVEG